MAAHHDDLVRLLAPADLGDDVGGVGLALEPRLHESETVTASPGRGHAPQPLRVLDRDRRPPGSSARPPRSRGLPCGERRASGPWPSARATATAPELRRGGGAGAAEAHGAAVALPVGREGDDLPLDLLAPERRQLLEAPHHHDRRGDPLPRRADAHAEAEHRQLALDRARRRGPTPARAPSAAPSRPAAGRPPAPRPSSPRGPRRRLLEPRRAAQAVADARGQVLELAPGALVHERAAEDAAGASRGSAPPGRPGPRAGAARGSRRARASGGRGWSGSGWASRSLRSRRTLPRKRGGPVLRSARASAAAR